MKQLPAQVDLPAVERDVLERWERGRVFERSLEATKDGEPWVFYEGPPTANGRPGLHHVISRTFKDVILRYRAMQGYKIVGRREGWDYPQMARESGTNALADAGIDFTQVQQGFVGYVAGDSTSGQRRSTNSG